MRDVGLARGDFGGNPAQHAAVIADAHFQLGAEGATHLLGPVNVDPALGIAIALAERRAAVGPVQYQPMSAPKMADHGVAG